MSPNPLFSFPTFIQIETTPGGLCMQHPLFTNQFPMNPTFTWKYVKFRIESVANAISCWRVPTHWTLVIMWALWIWIWLATFRIHLSFIAISFFLSWNTKNIFWRMFQLLWSTVQVGGVQNDIQPCRPSLINKTISTVFSNNKIIMSSMTAGYRSCTPRNCLS